jgi:hypothetical protein
VPPSDPPPAALTPLQKQTNRAIDRGVVYLKGRLQQTDQFYPNVWGTPSANTGAVALAGLTLLHCGVPADDRAVQRAAAVVRADRPKLTFTYSLALSLLFLDRLGDAADQDLVRGLALQLIGGQNVTGGWTYDCPLLAAAQQEPLLGQLQKGSYTPGGAAAISTDNSNTQFATLALWAARRHGVPAEPALAEVERRFRASQRPDGSWRYWHSQADTPLPDSTTCAGLLGLAVGRVTRKAVAAKEPARDEALDNGLRFLSRTVGKKALLSEEERARRQKDTALLDRLLRRVAQVQKAAAPGAAPGAAPPALNERDLQELTELARQMTALDNPKEGTILQGALMGANAVGDLYFLWSLERVAVIYDLQAIGGRDWYQWGAEIIVPTQKEDGSWSDRWPGVPDTCFALLFLRRANLASDLTYELRTRKVVPDDLRQYLQTKVIDADQPPGVSTPPRK